MKKLLSTIAATSGYLLATASAFAVNGTGPNDVNLCPEGQFNPLCGLHIQNALPAIISFIFIIAIIVALFYLIWGGFKWLTSGGDKTAVGAAREHIIAAIIGLVIIFLAYFILNILVGFFLKGQTVDFFTLPSVNTQ